MRHLNNTRKLGRTSKHREAMLANMVVSLIKHKRIKTTLAKAKAVRPLAEKLVTLGKSGTLHHRRLAISKIKEVEAVNHLFKEIAPKFKDRQGGYTRIIKLGQRASDAAPVAYIEWVENFAAEEAVAAPAEKSEKSEKVEKTEKAETKE